VERKTPVGVKDENRGPGNESLLRQLTGQAEWVPGGAPTAQEFYTALGT